MEKKVEDWLDLSLKSKDIEKKLEYCTKYLELNSNDADVWNYKADIFSKLGRSKEAIECGVKELKIEDTEYRIGVALGNDDKAIKCFDDVLRRKPDHARAWIKKGRVLINLKRLEEAIVCFDKVLVIGSSKVCEAKAWYWKGLAISVLEKYEESIKCFNKSLDIDPGDIETWFLKGLSFYDIKKYEEAIACYNEVLRISPRGDRANTAKKYKEMAEKEIENRNKT